MRLKLNYAILLIHVHEQYSSSVTQMKALLLMVQLKEIELFLFPCMYYHEIIV